MTSNGDIADTAANEPLNNTAKEKRQSFKVRVMTLSEETPIRANPFNFCVGLVGICCCIPAAGCGICLVVFALLVNLIPIIEIVIGAIYFDQENCPSESIALLLIIGGAITLLTGILESVGGGKKRQRAAALAKLKQNEGGEAPPTVIIVEDTHIVVKLLSALLQLASLCWLIAAAVIIYRLYGDVNYEDETNPHFCNIVLYRFSFWVVTISLLILPLTFCCLFCCGAAAMAGAAAVEAD